MNHTNLSSMGKPYLSLDTTVFFLVKSILFSYFWWLNPNVFHMRHGQKRIYGAWKYHHHWGILRMGIWTPIDGWVTMSKSVSRMVWMIFTSYFQVSKVYVFHFVGDAIPTCFNIPQLLCLSFTIYGDWTNILTPQLTCWTMTRKHNNIQLVLPPHCSHSTCIQNLMVTLVTSDLGAWMTQRYPKCIFIHPYSTQESRFPVHKHLYVTRPG